MTNHHNKAHDHEDAERYGAAARMYAKHGFSKLNEIDFAPGRDFRLGVASLIESVSCDTRTGRVQRARAVRDAAEAFIRHALREEDREDRCRDGLYHEWLGDLHLMTRSPTAQTYYETARSHYADTTPSSQRRWGGEEEFDYTYWAVESFLEEAGYRTEIESMYSLDFPGRIETKLDILPTLTER